MTLRSSGFEGLVFEEQGLKEGQSKDLEAKSSRREVGASRGHSHVEVEEVVQRSKVCKGPPLRRARIEEVTSRHKARGSGPPQRTRSS